MNDLRACAYMIKELVFSPLKLDENILILLIFLYKFLYQVFWSMCFNLYDPILYDPATYGKATHVRVLTFEEEGLMKYTKYT